MQLLLLILLKEKYTNLNYDKKNSYFMNILLYRLFKWKKYKWEINHMDEDKYLVLKHYLEYLNNNKVEQNNYSLNNLNLNNNDLYTKLFV